MGGKVFGKKEVPPLPNHSTGKKGRKEDGSLRKGFQEFRRGEGREKKGVH